ncbi:MAG: hypothetical protein E7500_09485 [Ruminococcus sp.]|nr:hypothetical protein [Ruminococcus sp.]
MIKLITGKKGTGKTKILIDMINDSVKTTTGSLVCIEKGETIRRSISYKVRWCDTEQFGINGYEAFYGFLAGMLAGNYDIKEVFVDGIFKIGGRDYNEFGAMLEKIDKLAEDTTVVFTVSADEAELSENVKQFIK